MRIATLTRSFPAGEITRDLFGRIALTKYQPGLKTCRNFEVLPHGPVANSPGFEYILETKNSTKHSVLIPFIFNTAQGDKVEFADQYLRFHTEGGTVLEAGGAITAITQANPGVVTQNAHGYNNGDTVFLSGIGGMTQLNGRFAVVTNKAANTYELYYFDGTKINTTTYGAYTAGGTGARVYEIASPYIEADLFDLHYTQSADVMTITHPSYDKRELKRFGAVNWTLTPISLAQTLVVEADPVVVNVGVGGGTPKLAEYLVTFVKASALEESVAYRPRTHSTAVGFSNVINAVTNANPGVFTTTAAHGYSVGQTVRITGVAGLNGWFDLFIGAINSVPTGTTFTVKRTTTPIDTTALSPYGGGRISAAVIMTGDWITGMTSAHSGLLTSNIPPGFVVRRPREVETISVTVQF